MTKFHKIFPRPPTLFFQVLGSGRWFLDVAWLGMDRFTVVGVLGFCCEPYWDSRNQRPSVALGKILSPLSSYSSSHHLEVCFVHTSGWCFYMQCWSLLIKLPDVFISSRVTNYINKKQDLNKTTQHFFRNLGEVWFLT